MIAPAMVHGRGFFIITIRKMTFFTFFHVTQIGCGTRIYLCTQNKTKAVFEYIRERKRVVVPLQRDTSTIQSKTLFAPVAHTFYIISKCRREDLLRIHAGDVGSTPALSTKQMQTTLFIIRSCSLTVEHRNKCLFALSPCFFPMLMGGYGGFGNATRS